MSYAQVCKNSYVFLLTLFTLVYKMKTALE